MPHAHPLFWARFVAHYTGACVSITFEKRGRPVPIVAVVGKPHLTISVHGALRMAIENLNGEQPRVTMKFGGVSS